MKKAFLLGWIALLLLSLPACGLARSGTVSVSAPPQTAPPAAAQPVSPRRAERRGSG